MVARSFGKKRASADDKKKHKKGGFVYKPRTAADVKERAERSTASFDSIFKQGVDRYEMKSGTHVARILPPTWDDDKHYGFTVWVHAFIGPDGSSFICPRKTFDKKCAACDAAHAAKKGGDQEEARNLEARERVLCYVLDRNEDDNLPRIWNMSGTQDREIAGLCMHGKTGEVIPIDHPDEGYDLTFKRSGKGLKTRYTSYQFDRDPSPISEDDDTQQEVLDYITENPIPSMLVYADNKRIAAALMGDDEEVDPDADDDDDDDVTKPAKGAKPKRKPAPADDDDDDDTGGDDDDDADPDDEPPARKPKPGKGKPAPADDDDDDADEPPARKPKPGKRKPVEEDDGDDDDDADAGDDEPEDDEPPARKPKRKPVVEEDDDDEPPARKPKRKPVEEDDGDEPPARKPKRKPVADDDDDDAGDADDDDEPDDEPPPRRNKLSGKGRR